MAETGIRKGHEDVALLVRPWGARRLPLWQPRRQAVTDAQVSSPAAVGSQRDQATFGTKGRSVKCSSPLANRSPAAFTALSGTFSNGTW